MEKLTILFSNDFTEEEIEEITNLFSQIFETESRIKSKISRPFAYRLPLPIITFVLKYVFTGFLTAIGTEIFEYILKKFSEVIKKKKGIIIEFLASYNDMEVVASALVNNEKTLLNVFNTLNEVKHIAMNELQKKDISEIDTVFIIYNAETSKWVVYNITSSRD